MSLNCLQKLEIRQPDDKSSTIIIASDHMSLSGIDRKLDSVV
jgi:hypothetical protein